MSTNESQYKAVENLQKALDKISRWTSDWKIKINENKSAQVTYTLRPKNNRLFTYINGTQIPQAELAKYPGLHLDSRLTWKHHVRQKANQIRQKQREMYWLIGRHSKLDLQNKRLVYLSIIKPIWMYGTQLWGWAHKSNREVIQRSQNKFLCTITNAYHYVSNKELHRDLNIKWIEEVIQEHANKHEKRLLVHTNVEAITNFLNQKYSGNGILVQ
jgi:hypothetical protein